MAIRVWWNEKRKVAWLIDELPGKPRKTEVFSPREWGGTKEGALEAAELTAAATRKERADKAARAAANVLRADEPIRPSVALRAWHADLQQRVSPEHWENAGSLIETRLAPYFDDDARRNLDLRKLTEYDVQNLAGYLADSTTRYGTTLHLDTIKACLRHLSAACQWLAAQDGLGFTPLVGITSIGKEVAEKRAPQGKREAWTHEEAEALLEMARGGALYPLLLVAIGTGARKAELLGLDWRYVNLRGSKRVKPHFNVEQVLTKKNQIKPAPKTPRSRRPVELAPSLVELLREMQDERFRQLGLRGDAPGLVFRSRTGEPWSYSGMNKSWERLRDRAFAARGVRPLEFHCARHTYITWALDTHTDMGWLSRQVGDSEETIHRHYKHLLRGAGSDHSFLNGLEVAGRRPRVSAPGEDEDAA